MFISAEKHFVIGHSSPPLVEPLDMFHVILCALGSNQSVVC
jgi:hypothetical protein